MRQHPLTFILSPSTGGEEILTEETINIGSHPSCSATRKAAETMSTIPTQETREGYSPTRSIPRKMENGTS